MSFKLGLKSLLADRRGSLVPILSFLLVPLLVGLGLAVDYGNVSLKRTIAQHALDSAVIAAALNYQRTGSIEDATTAAKQLFAGNCPAADCLPAAVPTISISLQGVITGRFDGTMDTTFMRVAGVTSADYSVVAETQLAPAFQEVHFLLDASESMTIAADQQDVARLMAVTKPWFSRPANAGWVAPNGCQFACHDPDGLAVAPVDAAGRKISMYQLAKSNGIKLREDLLLEVTAAAAKSMIDTSKSEEERRLSVSAHAFSENVQTLVAGAVDPAAISSALTNASVVHWGTKLNRIFDQAATMIGPSGNGQSRASARKTVILITDGVRRNHSYDDDAVQDLGAINPAWCKKLTDIGIRLIVVEVKYRAYDSHWYPEVAAVLPTTSANLRTCATRDPKHGILFFQTSEASQLTNALKDIVEDIWQDTFFLSL